MAQREGLRKQILTPQPQSDHVLRQIPARLVRHKRHHLHQLHHPAIARYGNCDDIKKMGLILGIRYATSQYYWKNT